MIAIDIRFLAQNMNNGIISSGVGVFFSEIVEGIRCNGKTNEFILIVDEDQYDVASNLFPDFKILKVNFAFSDPSKIFLYPLHYYFDGRKLKTVLIRNDVKCIWFPMAAPYWFLDTGIKTISTLHDIIPFHDNPKSISWKYGVINILKRSAKIITDSEYVKKDLIKTFNLPLIYEDKISKIPCSIICNDSFEPVYELFNKQFILDVNAYQERKNGFTLIDAFYKISNRIKCDLVFCGGYDENNTLDKMKKYVDEIGLNDRIHFFLSIPIECRNWLMKNADLVVSPSLSEGFGRSPIEAAMYKTPVLTSKSDSLVETTLGLLSYYNHPTDSGELSECIMRMLSHPPSNEELNNISDKMKEIYSPHNISLQYYKLFAQ